MRVRLLGPIDVTTAAGARRVAGLRPRAVLAVLGLAAGEVVSTDRLLDVVWDGRPPATGLNTLQRHVSYLRSVLGGRSAIAARAPGYLLNLGEQGTDIQVAEWFIAGSRRAAEPAERLAHLRAALQLWRGRPLADVAGLAWLDGQAERLTDLRLDVVQAVTDARLELGEHGLLVAELEELIREHPYREQLHGQLMLALYRCGRQADALGAYQQLRRRLADDLGIDPGPAVRDLEAAILRQDPAIDLAAEHVSEVRVASAVPRQLPAGIAGFTGREATLAELDALPTAADAPAVVAISGTPGVGKTTLAVHWAHQVAHRFPDGQLYVDLRGFDPRGSPLDPAEAIRAFLHALTVPPDRLPPGLDAQAALYRSELAGKRVLLVLDNARDVEQVRPLLPGAAGCLVVVTSRHQLTGLVAMSNAHPVRLDLLSDDEARHLLQQRLGKDRVAAEEDAVDDIIRACARLPLALAIVAARAAIEPRPPLRLLAGELREDQGALRALHRGDPGTDVAVIFSWSYQQLSGEAARLFRLLSLHPGPDVTVPAAASLAGRPVTQVRSLLAEICRASLVTEHSPGRYAGHDLLRAYATELTERLDTESERGAATRRILDHLLHTAYAADVLLDPVRDRPELTTPEPGVTPEPLGDRDHAFAWFTAEHAVLLSAVNHAASTSDAHAWQLAWALGTYFGWRGHWHDQAVAARAAIAAARRVADPSAQARAHRLLAYAYNRLSRFEDAYTELVPALELSREAGDLMGQGHAHGLVGHIMQRQNRHAEALDHSNRALELFRAVGARLWAAETVHSIGWTEAQLGDYRQALAHCEEALDVLEEIGDNVGIAAAWSSLGFVHLGLADSEQSVRCYRHAVDLFVDVGDRYREAVTLKDLGDACQAFGAVDDARDVWRWALAIFDELDHAHAERVRARLAAT